VYKIQVSSRGRPAATKFEVFGTSTEAASRTSRYQNGGRTPVDDLSGGTMSGALVRSGTAEGVAGGQPPG
jgi:hypothetical protein